jgi:hypothetical protein
MSNVSPKIVLGLFSLSIALMMGCATVRKPPEIVWPLPPESPRIKYVKSISKVEDIQEKTLLSRMKEFIIGKDPTAHLRSR